MMTRDEQVRAALKIVQPKASRRDECVKLIHDTLDFLDIEEASLRDGFNLVSMPTKSKMKALQKALNRVRVTYKVLPWNTQMAFRDLEITVQKWLTTCDQFLNEPSNPKMRSNRQRDAVHEATLFLGNYGWPSVTSRRSKWCLLAAIFYGDKQAKSFALLH